MFEDPPRIKEIELEPVLSQGELVSDNWWLHPAQHNEFKTRHFWLEIIILIIPILFACVYQLFIASNQYVSESRFMIRTATSSDVTNLASFMQDQKVTRASDETYAACEYLVSRDAMNTLVVNNRLKEIFSRPSIDLLNRFPNIYTRDTNEELYLHFRKFIEVTLESDSGIAALSVRSFAPEDSLMLSTALLKDVEGFVNQLNDQVYRDELKLAASNVEEQRANFVEVEARLASYRNSQGIVDPNSESADDLLRVSAMMTQLSQIESELRKQIILAPRGPQVVSLTSDAAALREQIAKQRNLMTGPRSSLATKFSEFDQIMLDRTLVTKSLESALDQLANARRDLDRRQYYLQIVVQPNLPDQAAYPRRLLNIIMVVAACLSIYAIAGALLKNIREHQL